MKQHILTETLNLRVLIFFVFLKGSFCFDPSYEACLPTHCGDGLYITYPFFVRGLQRPFCGYPGFEVRCNTDGFMILPLSGNDYLVRAIDYENNSLRLVNAATIFCQTQFSNMTLDPNNRFLVDYDPSSILVILSNCSNEMPVTLTRYRIMGSCGKRNELVMLWNDKNLNLGKKLCGGVVTMHVELHGGEGRSEVVDGGNYQQIAERGFIVRWHASDCGVCKQSGGRCGFNTTALSFRCFCPDRPRMVRCPFDAGRRFQPLILFFALSSGAMVIPIVIIVCLRRRTKNQVNVENFLKNHEFLAPKRYSYLQIKQMTHSSEAKIGQGGFGSVYKGALHNGNVVAVKVLNESKGNGDDFINEVASVGRTSHVNIVTLLGFCSEGDHRALIYEFMPNGSLERFIYRQASSSGNRLGWEKLHQIAIGIARGLEYLHSGCNTRILHFDIKPHNILLDQDLCPKISDFGLAKLFPEKRSRISMSQMRGTPGYIAPELVSRNFGEVSHKSDVYSYGMMILEMVGGRKNIEVEVDHTSEIYFPHWIYKRIELNEEFGLYGIVSDDEHEMAKKMIIVGLWCIQMNPLSRPTITKVLEMLEGDVELLEIPPKPYLSSPSSTD